MKAQLIKLKGGNIITTSEEPEQGDLCFYSRGKEKDYADWGLLKFDGDFGEIWDEDMCKKVIASELPDDLPTIDYNNSEADLGVVDIHGKAIIDIEVDSKTVIQEPPEGGGFLYRVESGLIGGFSNSPRTVEEALKEGWVLRKIPIIKNNQIKIMDICETL